MVALTRSPLAPGDVVTLGTLRFEVFDTRVMGRGLRALTEVPRGAEVARMDGALVRDAPTDGESFFVRAGLWLRLRPPTRAFAGNVCNTGAGVARNNCRYAYARGSDYVRLVATRRIRAGEEILVPYGGAYSRRLRGRGV